MVELDDEMLLDMTSPTKQRSPARKSSGSDGGAGNLLDELNYQETQLNPDGFFSDANDQVSFGRFKLCLPNQVMRVTLER